MAHGDPPRLKPDRFPRAGGLQDYRAAHVYDVRDGKLARCFEQPRDPAVFEDAWGAAPA